MANLTIDTALDGLLDSLSRCLDAESARRVTELRVDPAVQSRIDARRLELRTELLARNRL